MRFWVSTLRWALVTATIILLGFVASARATSIVIETGPVDTLFGDLANLDQAASGGGADSDSDLDSDSDSDSDSGSAAAEFQTQVTDSMANDIEVGIFASDGGLPGAAIHNERLTSADHFTKGVSFTVLESLFPAQTSLASHTPQSPIPEPSSMLLFAVGLLVVGAAVRRQL